MVSRSPAIRPWPVAFIARCFNWRQKKFGSTPTKLRRFLSLDNDWIFLHRNEVGTAARAPQVCPSRSRRLGPRRAGDVRGGDSGFRISGRYARRRFACRAPAAGIVGILSGMAGRIKVVGRFSSAPRRRLTVRLWSSRFPRAVVPVCRPGPEPTTAAAASHRPCAGSVGRSSSSPLRLFRRRAWRCSWRDSAGSQVRAASPRSRRFRSGERSLRSQ